MNLTIREITRLLKGQLILGDPKGTVRRAEIDSRRISHGDAFFALKGDKKDGHDYVMTACRAGATAVVVSHLKWLQSSQGFTAGIIQVKNPMESLQLMGQVIRNGFKGNVVGITGSNGKTTTKQMLAEILHKTGPGLHTSRR